MPKAGCEIEGEGGRNERVDALVAVMLVGPVGAWTTSAFVWTTIVYHLQVVPDTLSKLLSRVYKGLFVGSRLFPGLTTHWWSKESNRFSQHS